MARFWPKHRARRMAVSVFVVAVAAVALVARAAEAVCPSDPAVLAKCDVTLAATPVGGAQVSFSLGKTCRPEGYHLKRGEGPQGAPFAANVCGQVPHECETASTTAEFCMAEDDVAACAQDPLQPRHGSSMVYNFSQPCAPRNGQQGGSLTSCEHCTVFSPPIQSADQVQWALIDPSDAGRGVKAVMPEVPYTPLQRRFTASPGCSGYRSTFEFHCDCHSPSLLELERVFSDASYNCNFTLLFRGTQACYSGFCQSGLAPTLRGGGSGGSTFLTVLFSALILYLAFANFVHYRQTRTLGIPETHRDACLDILGLVRNGLVFVVHRVGSLFSRGSASVSPPERPSHFHVLAVRNPGQHAELWPPRWGRRFKRGAVSRITTH